MVTESSRSTARRTLARAIRKSVIPAKSKTQTNHTRVESDSVVVAFRFFVISSGLRLSSFEVSSTLSAYQPPSACQLENPAGSADLFTTRRNRCRNAELPEVRREQRTVLCD